MHLYQLVQWLSYTIVPAAVTGIFKYPKIIPAYRPFIYMVCLAALNEIASNFFIGQCQTNAVNANIYILAECMLLLWLFANWAAGKNQKKRFFIVALLLLLLWIFDNLLWHSLRQFNSYFRVGYSLVLVFLAIDRMAAFIILEKRNILRHAGFLTAAGVLVFFCYKAVTEMLFITNHTISNTMQLTLILLMAGVNCCTNIIFLLAALCLPTKQTYTLHCS